MSAGFNLPEVPAGSHGGEAAVGPDFLRVGHADDLDVMPAQGGDHYHIHRLLLAVLQEPTSDDFQHLLEEPGYDPRDRLLIRRHGEIVAHVQICHRLMQFGSLQLPLADFRHLVTLPEYGAWGLARRLLAAALLQARKAGAMLATMRAPNSEVLRTDGWLEWHRDCTSLAPPRGVLAHLPQPELPREVGHQQRSEGHAVRIWRRNELDALMRLHEVENTHAFGAPLRDDMHWRWLLARRGYDRIYVAQRQTPAPHSAACDQVAGYAVMRRGRVLELCAPHAPWAARALLARVCADAIEYGIHCVQLDAPPNDPWHACFQRAGGQHRDAAVDQGRNLMAWVFDTDQLLTELKPLLCKRWGEATMELPAALGLQVDNRKMQLAVRGRNLTISAGHLGRSYLRSSQPLLNQLLLGQHAPREQVRRGTLSASTRLAVEAAEVLFPRLPLWRPPWDDQPGANGSG